MYFIVSIDTEEDMPNWRPETKTTTQNIQALPDIQVLFDTYSIRPTYLVDYPVLQNPASLKTLQNLKNSAECEIGLHLHSWNTPPIQPMENGKATVLNELSANIQIEKITFLHHYFIDKLGFAPTSYRAGRYGITTTTLETLSGLGYLIDSSVVPLTNFSQYGAPDFRSYQKNPFWIKTKNSKILELPVSVDLVGKISKRIFNYYFDIPEWTHIKGVFHRLNLARLLWLRPTTYSLAEMKQLAVHIVEQQDAVPVLNMMFHSSELYPGTTPYNRTIDDVARFKKRLADSLQFIVNELGLRPLTLSEFANVTINNDQLHFPEKQAVFS